jgi:predicted membrane channel-forming protein YqfA (hemolysin III family)
MKAGKLSNKHTKAPTQSSAGKKTAEKPPLIPKTLSYTQLEFFAILALIGIFILLFVWFTLQNDQRIFQYYIFAVMTTLVFSGVLKAVGAYRRAGIALGGSIVIFAAVLYITKDTFEKDAARQDTVAKLQSTIARQKTDNKELTDDLASANSKVANLLNQNIKIFTYRPNGKPMQEAQVKYLGEHGELIAHSESNAGWHIIPYKDLADDTAIWVTVDPASVPAERRTGDIGIDRFIYKIKPLELKLYLRDKGWR